MTQLPKLSVLITSYNHEKYIQEALESVLAQKTQFPFEIIVSDDCSTDNTRKILEDYQQRLPSMIRILPSEKNLGITKNLQRGLSACCGEYIAILEGDDYWISPLKLQKQVEFLDHCPECSFCFNGLLFLNHKGIYVEFQNGLSPQSTILSLIELIENNFIGNFSTCMYRNEVVRKLPPKIYDVFTVDWMFNMACAELGSIGYLPLQMTIYRKQGQGAWSSLADSQQIKKIMDLLPIYDELLDYRYSTNFTKSVNFYRSHLKRAKRKAFLKKILLIPVVTFLQKFKSLFA